MTGKRRGSDTVRSRLSGSFVPRMRCSFGGSLAYDINRPVRSVRPRPKRGSGNQGHLLLDQERPAAKSLVRGSDPTQYQSWSFAGTCVLTRRRTRFSQIAESPKESR
jgi:hypothetical protein